MADYNVDTLENKIVVEAQEALKQLDNIIGHVDKAKSSLEQIKNATGLKAIDKEAKNAASSLNKLQLIGKTLKQTLNFGGLIYGAKRLANFMSESAEKSIDYIETLNLFEVSMGKTLDKYGNLDSASSQYYTKALKFQKQLNGAFGTNIEETMRYQALYNQMTKSMGINDNASYIISENLTKLGIDLASLFNKEESATMEALRAGVLAGQTKPLRNYGLDVTQQSLKPLAEQLGLDRGVSELSQAEKMILRYIVVLKQASAAHGDFANTIESPANQLKIFHQQITELKTSIGNLFQGLLGQILPYINGAIMAIKELIKLIGVLFGFEVTSNNSNLAQTTGIEDLEEGLSSAVGSAKELKAQILGFDNINNITTQTSSGGGGGSISPNGIDQKLLDALSEYDNLMGNVRMKANDIRDTILKWLGLTGDVEHDTQRVRELLDIIGTVLKVIAVTWLGTKIVGTIGSIISGLGQTGVLGMTNKIQLAVAGIAASWGLAKLSAKAYAKAFKEDDTGALAMGIAGTTGSILSGTISGAVIGGLPGALVGTGVAAIGNIINAGNSAADEYIRQLTQTMEHGYDMFKESAKKAQDTNNTMTMEDYNRFTQEYKDIWDYNGLSREKREEIAKIIDMYRNLAVAEVNLFDNGGQKIENYYNKYSNLVEGIVSSSKEWEAMYNSYISNNDALEEVTGSLDVFLTKLGNSSYSTTIEDISKLNKILDEMSNYVKASGDAFVDAAILSTNSLKDEKYISTETADAVVANAIRKANAEGNAFEAYKLKLQDYTTQLQKGIITQDEYNTKVAQAKVEYEKAKTSANNTATAVQFLKDTISSKIDLKNWNTAIEYTQKLGDLYTENADKLKTNYDSELQYYNDQIAWTEDYAKTVKEAYGEESKEYSKIKEELIALQEARTGATKQYEDDVQELKETVYKSLKIVERQLIDSGYDIQTDAQGLYTSVQEQLNKIGLDTQIANNIDKELSKTEKELDKHRPTIADKMNLITKVMGATANAAIDLGFKVNVDYSGLKSKLQNIKNSVDKMAGVPIVGSVFSGFKANLDSLINKLSVGGYASGGMPDVGEIFMAREAGPELVGRIGRRTTVANNAQIVEAVSKGVYEAVSAAMPNASTVQLDIRADEGIIVKKAAEGFREHVTQTGELPFPVPV